jgi:hypothetical protein
LLKVDSSRGGSTTAAMTRDLVSNRLVGRRSVTLDGAVVITDHAAILDLD